MSSITLFLAYYLNSQFAIRNYLSMLYAAKEEAQLFNSLTPTGPVC
jgi:hypothetical protein